MLAHSFYSNYTVKTTPSLPKKTLGLRGLLSEKTIFSGQRPYFAQSAKAPSLMPYKGKYAFNRMTGFSRGVFCSKEQIQHFFILDRILSELDHELKELLSLTFSDKFYNEYGSNSEMKTSQGANEKLYFVKNRMNSGFSPSYNFTSTLAESSYLLFNGTKRINSASPFRAFSRFSKAFFVLTQMPSENKTSGQSIRYALTSTFFNSILSGKRFLIPKELLFRWRIRHPFSFSERSKKESYALYQIRNLEDKIARLAIGSSRVALNEYRDDLIAAIDERAVLYIKTSLKGILRKPLGLKTSRWVLLQRKDIRGLRNFQSVEDFIFLSSKYAFKKTKENADSDN